MIGYVDVQGQVDKDFHRALLKPSVHRWKAVKQAMVLLDGGRANIQENEEVEIKV